MPSNIFISYRRQDASKDARAIFERLRREFGEQRVFIDLDGIEPGEDFVELLERQLDNCEVLVALIGRDWADARNELGQRRLDDEHDFVRIEIRAALTRGIKVFPVLIDGAQPLRASQLPADLQPLVRRQAIPLDYAKFDADLSRLARAIHKAVAPPAAPAGVEEQAADGKTIPPAPAAQAKPVAADMPPAMVVAPPAARASAPVPVQAAPPPEPPPEPPTAPPPAPPRPPEPVAAAAPAVGPAGPAPAPAEAPRKTAGAMPAAALAAAVLLAVALYWMVTSGGTPGTAPGSAAAPAAAGTPEPLKVGFVYVGPVADAGWTLTHDQGRQHIQAKYGNRIQTSFVEKVPEGPDAERVFRDLAAQGHQLVIGTSFGYGDAMLKVAKDHPGVFFEHATGFKTAPNLRVYDSRLYEAAYLAGILAGGMSKSNTLGFVGSFPIPEVMRNLNAYLLGAQSVNPKARLKVVWVNTWHDPPRESGAAAALMSDGADVLLQNTDSSAVLQAAEKAGKFGFGLNSDMRAAAPQAHLASAVLNWGGYYDKAVDDVLKGSWAPGSAKWGLQEGMVDLVGIHPAVPAELRARVDSAKAALQRGELAVFKGPLRSNTGKQVLAEGVVADAAWRDALNLYLQGVEGRPPGGN